MIRHANNLESVLTYEGTVEMHTLVVGQALTGESAFRLTAEPARQPKAAHPTGWAALMCRPPNRGGPPTACWPSGTRVWRKSWKHQAAPPSGGAAPCLSRGSAQVCGLVGRNGPHVLRPWDGVVVRRLATAVGAVNSHVHQADADHDHRGERDDPVVVPGDVGVRGQAMFTIATTS